jgi:hypothetical protein
VALLAATRELYETAVHASSRIATGLNDRGRIEAPVPRTTFEDVPTDSYMMAMSAAYRMDAPPGLAGRWLVERLKENNSVRSNAGRAPPKARRQIMRQLAKEAQTSSQVVFRSFVSRGASLVEANLDDKRNASGLLDRLPRHRIFASRKARTIEIVAVGFSP